MRPPRYAKLRQKATYWPPIRVDRHGELLLAEPVEIKVRWEDGHEQFLDVNGETQTSNAAVYTEQEVVLSGMLWLGKLVDAPADPKTDNNSWEVRNAERVPNLRSNRSVWKAML